MGKSKTRSRSLTAGARAGRSTGTEEAGIIREQPRAAAHPMGEATGNAKGPHRCDPFFSLPTWHSQLGYPKQLSSAKSDRRYQIHRTHAL